MLNFLTKLTNGKTVIGTAIQTSSGVGDAEKVIGTDASGKIDISLLPGSVISTPVTAIADGALTAGDFINVYDDLGTAKVRKADASDATKICNGFVLASYLDGATVSCYTRGENTAFAGTAGAIYYLSATTPGLATTTAVAETPGNFHQVLGFGTGTSFVFEFDDVIYM
jgi:hypothetical protein